ncbi:hypothetical protein [Streptomyces phaeochromogenes]|uniref:hypothetical protein n=1 Tax=Streptomyces phaeochromogenes TaxID=1923 RepID=UPI0012FE99F1|nr:hypothetical protein [Streptomyces phaeochromogenes]
MSDSCGRVMTSLGLFLVRSASPRHGRSAPARWCPYAVDPGPRGRPNKAGGTGEGKSVQAHYTYAHVDEAGEPIPDGATHKILLEKHLFTQANPERAADEQKKRRQEQEKREAEQKITREERNEKSRINLLHTIGEARAVVDRLTAEAADFPSPLTEHPMGGRADWKQVHQNLRDLEEALLDVRPPAGTEPTRLRDADRREV